MLRAFHKAFLKNASLRLLILGEGQLRPQLEAQIAETFPGLSPVQLLGNQPNPGDYMAHAAAFVSSSQVEGFGNVMIEALATGVPVIATDAPFGSAEILEGGQYGQIVPRYDEDALAEALLANNYPVTQAARQQRARQFSAETLLPVFLEQYKSLIE